MLSLLTVIQVSSKLVAQREREEDLIKLQMVKNCKRQAKETFHTLFKQAVSLVQR
jgi:hypothetical protein